MPVPIDTRKKLPLQYTSIFIVILGESTDRGYG